MSEYQRYDPLTDAGSLGFDPTGPGPLSESPPPVQFMTHAAPSLPPPPSPPASPPPPLDAPPPTGTAPATPADAPPTWATPTPTTSSPVPQTPASDPLREPPAPTPPRRPTAPRPRPGTTQNSLRSFDRVLRSGSGSMGPRARPEGPARRFGRLWMLGAVLVLAGILAFVSGITSLVAAVNGVVDGPIVRDGRPQQVFLRTDEERTLWVESAGSAPRCQVTPPPGGRLPRLGTSSSSIESGGVTYRVLNTITARSTGAHQVLCTGGSARLVEGSGGGGILRGVLTLLGGVFAFVLGIIIAIGSLFGWNTIRRNSRLPVNRRGRAWGF